MEKGIIGKNIVYVDDANEDRKAQVLDKVKTRIESENTNRIIAVTGYLVREENMQMHVILPNSVKSVE